jgi:hypothetical protein
MTGALAPYRVLEAQRKQLKEQIRVKLARRSQKRDHWFD